MAATGILSAQATAPASAEAPATAPATGPLTRPAGTTKAPPAASTIEQVCQFSAEELLQISLITDGDEEWLTTPLCVLLGRAAMLPKGNDVFEKAMWPKPNEFWGAPQKYRRQLVALEGTYAGLTESKKAGISQWWPTRDFSVLHVAVSRDQVVLVALAEKPPDLKKYSKIKFVGFFYKTAQLPVIGNPNEKRIYPVFVARAIVPLGSTDTAPSGLGRPISLISAIVVLLALALFIQLRLKARKQRLMMMQRVHALSHPAEPDSDFDIDPQLQQEVERFETEQEAAHGHAAPPAEAQEPEKK
jgi:hypothetical protein